MPVNNDFTKCDELAVSLEESRIKANLIPDLEKAVNSIVREMMTYADYTDTFEWTLSESSEIK